MVTNYGMSSDLGVQIFGQPNHEVFLGRDYGNTQDYSEETARRIDEEVARIMREAHDRAYEILSGRKEQMNLMASVLLERETVDGEACEALLENKWADYLKLEQSGEPQRAANTLASKEGASANSAAESASQVAPSQSTPSVSEPQQAVSTPAAGAGSTEEKSDGFLNSLEQKIKDIQDEQDNNGNSSNK
jgi:cell division protease FtsH